MTASSVPTNRSNRRDRNRRRRWFTKVHAAKISRGCIAWLVCLAERSSDTAKPVWGYQEKQAKEIGCSARQVRRYRAEAEEAELIETVRAEPERGANGIWTRARTNIYRFCVPPAKKKAGMPSSDPADTHVPLNHLSTRDIYNLEFKDNHPDPWSNPPPMGFAAMKAMLGKDASYVS